MCCCGTSICAVCPGCGGLCGTCTCTEALCPSGFGCGLTGEACAPCGPTTASGACCIGTLTGSNVDLCNLPLTAPSGDPNLDALTPASGATDPPPSPAQCPAAPQSSGSGSHGGSGGGSARSATGGGASAPHNTACASLSKMQSALNRFGTSLASLFGKAEQGKTNLESKAVGVVTTPAFLLMLLIVGGLMLLLAWGKET